MGSTNDLRVRELAAAQGAYFIRTTWVLYGIGALAAHLRVAIRFYLARNLGTEEYLVLFAVLCWTADTACIPFIVKNGTNSMPEEKRPTIIPGSEEWTKRTMAGKMFVGAWVAYITMIWLLKASILVFYGRLTEKLQEQRIIKVAWSIVGVTWLACVLSMFLVCRPFRGNWQIYPNPGRQCTEGHEYVWVVGILNILTDMMLLAIPLPMVFRLRASIGRKIMLGCLFGLGFFVIIATALRIYFTIEGGNIQNMTFWSMIETCTAIIVANAPGIRAIFVHIKINHLKSSSASGSRQQNTWEMKKPKSKPRAKDPFEVGHTVNIEAGDSTERIVEPYSGLEEDPELGDQSGRNGPKKVYEDGERMVIHQRVTYEVRAYEATPEEINEARQESVRQNWRST